MVVLKMVVNSENVENGVMNINCLFPVQLQ